MIRYLRKNKGITLVALVITIVVLLILAGISIQAITSTGLFEKTKQATQESKYANAAEKVALAVNASYDETGKINDNYLKENVNKIEGLNKKVETVTYDLKIVVDGFEFTISEYGKITGEKNEVATLPDNTKDTDAGTNVKVPDNWNSQNVKYIKTTDGTEVTTLETVATVYAVSDGNNNTVPIPNGFYYVGGNINSGIVISDDERDKNKFAGQADVPAGAIYNENGTVKTENLSSEEQAQTLFGNQFVWIPCTVDNYKKCNVWNGTTQTGTTLQNASWEKETDVSEIKDIQKYGGFYIGRYEAGTSNLTSSKIDFSKGYSISSWLDTNFRAEFITSGKITCKAGEIPYYHSDYTTAQKMSKAMYSNNKFVQSGLVTGTMWDVTLNYFKSNDSSLNLTNFALGNYNNAKLTNCKGRYIQVNSSTGSTSDIVLNSDGARHYGIMTTASSENTKKNNIYDMAGNLWEWTEEISYDLSNNYYMTRGR